MHQTHQILDSHSSLDKILFCARLVSNKLASSVDAKAISEIWKLYWPIDWPTFPLLHVFHLLNCFISVCSGPFGFSAGGIAFSDEDIAGGRHITAIKIRVGIEMNSIQVSSGGRVSVHLDWCLLWYCLNHKIYWALFRSKMCSPLGLSTLSY